MKAQISDMHPELAKRFAPFSAKMAESGVPFALNSVLRNFNEQLAYAAQGRTFEELCAMLREHDWIKSLAKVTELHKTVQGLALVNRLRADAGMYLLDAKENSYTVTQTLNSRHFPDANGKSRAFDIVILRGDKKPTWDTKWDGDQDGIGDYEEAARIMESVGLVAGGHWKSFADWPHGELPKTVA